MPRTITENGVRRNMTPEEETEWNVHIAAEEARLPNFLVRMKIHDLEAEVTPRRIRDAFADPAWMNAQEAKIKLERDKL